MLCFDISTIRTLISMVSPLTCHISMCLHLQSRSPKHGPSPQPSVGDQVDHLSLASLESLDTMSEADTPTGFTRGSRVRASLPVVRSTNQTKDRSLGRLWMRLLGWRRSFERQRRMSWDFGKSGIKTSQLSLNGGASVCCHKPLPLKTLRSFLSFTL